MPRKPQPTDHVDPIVVSPAVAQQLLDCSHVILYRLINSNEVESYLCGKSRKIVVASIHRYIAKRLAAGVEKSRSPVNPFQKAAAQ